MNIRYLQAKNASNILFRGQNQGAETRKDSLRGFVEIIGFLVGRLLLTLGVSHEILYIEIERND